MVKKLTKEQDLAKCYEYYSKMDLWTINDAVELIMGKNPKCELKNKKNLKEKEKENLIWDCINNCIQSGALVSVEIKGEYIGEDDFLYINNNTEVIIPDKYLAKDIVKWSKEKGFLLPKPLLDLMDYEHTHNDSEYISPYMKLMSRCIKENNLPENNLKKDSLIDWFQKELPKIDPNASNHKAEMLATFVRDPDMQKGGAKKQSKG